MSSSCVVCGKASSSSSHHPDIKCSNCDKVFHQLCIPNIKNIDGLGLNDPFFYIECSECTKGSFLVQRLSSRWLDKIDSIIYELMINRPEIGVADASGAVYFPKNDIVALAEMRKRSWSPVSPNMASLAATLSPKYPSDGAGRYSTNVWPPRLRQYSEIFAHTKMGRFKVECDVTESGAFVEAGKTGRFTKTLEEYLAALVGGSSAVKGTPKPIAQAPQASPMARKRKADDHVASPSLPKKSAPTTPAVHKTTTAPTTQPLKPPQSQNASTGNSDIENDDGGRPPRPGAAQQEGAAVVVRRGDPGWTSHLAKEVTTLNESNSKFQTVVLANLDRLNTAVVAASAAEVALKARGVPLAPHPIIFQTAEHGGESGSGDTTSSAAGGAILPHVGMKMIIESPAQAAIIEQKIREYESSLEIATSTAAIAEILKGQLTEVTLSRDALKERLDLVQRERDAAVAGRIKAEEEVTRLGNENKFLRDMLFSKHAGRVAASSAEASAARLLQWEGRPV